MAVVVDQLVAVGHFAQRFKHVAFGGIEGAQVVPGFGVFLFPAGRAVVEVRDPRAAHEHALGHVRPDPVRKGPVDVQEIETIPVLEAQRGEHGAPV